MENYVTSKIIKELRENKKMTQLELANVLNVSDKTISKWETGKGLPDISLIEPLAKALGVSIIELMKGEYIINENIASNMKKINFYVCPICGNVICSVGESVISCCGIVLPKLYAEDEDSKHDIEIRIIENEYYISMKHEMTKNHYISFIAYVTGDRVQIVKLFPEQNIEARFFNRGKGTIYIYCNKDGLFKKNM